MAASMLSRRAASIFNFNTINSLLPAVLINQIAKYNPRPLRLNLKDPYIPDKASEKTPEWQKTEKHERRLFGRYGHASGVDPVRLWPSAAKLDELVAEEKEWHPPMETMLDNIAAREREEEQKRIQREKIIAESMAKMPKLIADWKKQKRDVKLKKLEEKQKRDRLMAIAKERFGFAVDPRSFKFKEMEAEIEKEEKKQRRLLRRQKREEAQDGPSAPAAAASGP